jgi:hypothetical protein
VNTGIGVREHRDRVIVNTEIGVRERSDRGIVNADRITVETVT